MKKIFYRKKFIEQILDFQNKGIIKVLLGQRRSGKSMIMLSMIDKMLNKGIIQEGNYIYINKEESKWDHIKNYADLNLSTANYNYIFVDEVQEIVDREKSIRNLQVAGKDIYICGSNSNLLSGELATLLSGRYVHFDIYPLDYKEFLKVNNKKNNKENFLLYTNIGGMPYYIQLGLDNIGLKYTKDVYDTIVLKDIVKRYKIRNIDFFEKLLYFIAQNIGSIFSALSISNYLANQNIEISANTINEYLNFCNKALFLHNISRYDIKGKKIFENKQKHFFTDIGIRNSICGYNINDIGGVLENIVFSNLIANDRKVYVGEIGNLEVDFIAEKNTKKIYIQVCYLLSNPDTIKREFGVYKNIKDSRPKYVLSLDDITGPSPDGIIHQTIYDFIYNLSKF